MRSMAPASTSSLSLGSSRPSRRGLGLVAGLTGLACLASGALAPVALAETGAPLPPGYTGDVTAAPQPPPPPAQQLQYQPAPEPIAPEMAQEQQPNGAEGVSPDEYADADPAALTDFREPLAPYGQWVQDPTYGTIWVPDSSQVGADFAPYQTAGSWGTSDSGDWMWQSDYSWGYIPFHYGRWVWATNSWGWIPGRRYAPAWVTWRVGEGGYLGWAPLPPRWYWGGGRAIGLGTVPYAAYCFVPTNYAFASGVSRYVVRDRGMIGAVAATTRPYHPATPSVGLHNGGISHGPSFSAAHIPASASPRSRVAADPRAMAFATHSSTAAMRRAYMSPSSAAHATYGQSVTIGGTRSGGGWASGYSQRPSRSPALRTPSQVQAYPSSHAAYPSVQSRGAYTLGQHYAQPGGAFHPPAAAAPSRPRSAPQGSAPHVSASHSSGGRHR